jgi:hypothetical protein
MGVSALRAGGLSRKSAEPQERLRPSGFHPITRIIRAADAALLHAAADAALRVRCDPIRSDTASGKSMAGRPALAAALDELDAGDALVIAEWDRATRSMWDGLQILAFPRKRGQDGCGLGLCRQAVADALDKLKALRVLNWLRRCTEDTDETGAFRLRQLTNAYAILLKSMRACPAKGGPGSMRTGARSRAASPPFG